MPFCRECKVEVESYMEVCPLCSTPLDDVDVKPESETAAYPDKPMVDADKKVTRFFVWEIISSLLLTAFLIVVLTNFILEFTFSWAWYPMTSIFFAWLLITIPVFLIKRPLLITILAVLSIMAFIGFIDFIYDLSFDWYHIIALPISVVLILVTTLIVIISRKVKKKGLNIASFIMFGSAIIVICLEGILDFGFKGKIMLSWSLAVLVPLVLIGGLFLYLHYRLLKNVDIKKLFQI
ncbi:MAG: hypothetical protein JXB88_22325 [Spirochaetales bacterium]|nr:hypothetical protein [Spirochaetales bacterium]